MTRVKRGFVARRKKNKLRKEAKGFRGTLKTATRRLKQAILKSRTHATRGRRQKKRTFRALWITRINAALALRDISYSQFLGALKKANIILNRKSLSEIAIHDPKAFDKIVEIAQKA